jgi:hypothetical protein
MTNGKSFKLEILLWIPVPLLLCMFLHFLSNPRDMQIFWKVSLSTWSEKAHDKPKFVFGHHPIADLTTPPIGNKSRVWYMSSCAAMEIWW